jgi:predicted TIM-barrel fold metal-dependent hydrolase
MTGPPLVDVHMHLYQTKASGEWWKAGYEIFEYGPKEGVGFSRYSGDVDDAVTALAEAGFAHGVAVNLFGMELFRLEAIDALPPDQDAAARAAAVEEIEATLPERMRAYNRWLVDAVASIPEITPFVAVDPWALSPQDNVAHLREMAGRGARGIKLHPVVQRFEPDDERMHPIYRACQEMGMVVLSHTGSAKGGDVFAEPAGFAPVLSAFPTLKVVLAHVGGGAWRQTAQLADAFPQVSFDLCEIIEWTGAPNAPTDRDLAGLIARIGPERVMLGTDFPWYDLQRTARLVMDLPDLPRAEKEAILGENAARILELPI